MKIRLTHLLVCSPFTLDTEYKDCRLQPLKQSASLKAISFARRLQSREDKDDFSFSHTARMFPEPSNPICTDVYRQRTSSSSSSSSNDSSADGSKESTSFALRKDQSKTPQKGGLRNPGACTSFSKQWRQSTASLSPSLYSNRSSKTRPRRNVHMMKGSGASRLLLLQQESSSAVLATFQARLCLGTDYLPIYELNDFKKVNSAPASSSSAQSSSSSNTSLHELPNFWRKRRGVRRKKLIVTGKRKDKPIKRLTFIRLTKKGIIFSDVPSIKLGSESSFRRLTRKSSDGQKSQKPLVRRTPSMQKAFLSWSSIDHIWLKKRRMDLHLKAQAGGQENTASLLQFKFTIIRDVHAFITAGLAYGYFYSEGLLLPSFKDFLTENDANGTLVTISPSSPSPQLRSCSSPSSSSTSGQNSPSKRPHNVLANLWAKVKSPSKGSASNISRTSSRSNLPSTAVYTQSCPDSTTDKCEEEKKGGHQKGRIIACVRWANRLLFRGRRRRQNQNSTV